MIVTIETTRRTRDSIAAARRAAAGFDDALADGLESAAVTGAESVRGQLVMGRLGLTMRHPASGLAASVAGWMVDRSGPLAALGVPANSPAAGYAAILNSGGVIVPRNAKALAIPVSDEAKRHESPRDMANLVMVPRKDSPPLLVRKLTRRGDMTGMQVHWVLVASVTIPAFRWLENGAAAATPEITEDMAASMESWSEGWN